MRFALHHALGNQAYKRPNITVCPWTWTAIAEALVSCPINKHANAKAIFSPDKLGTEKSLAPRVEAPWGR